MTTEAKSLMTEGLNGDQLHSFNDIADFIASDESMYVLKGYAGTGKTFLIKRLITYIYRLNRNRRIAVTAPTNKAVKVIKEGMSNLKNIDFMTIHSLLELKEQISNTGEINFVPEKNKNLRDRKGNAVRPKIESYTYVIVDETSMLSQHLFWALHKQIQNDPFGMLKIIFLGDPAQIPPVKEKDAIPFLEEYTKLFRTSTLNTIMRQADGNPIVDASFKLRDNLNVAQPIPNLVTDNDDLGRGITHLNAGNQKIREYLRDFILPLLFEKEFKEDADHAKVIAWRNKTVDLMNQLIRKPLFGWNIDDIVVGEKLIINKPILSGKKMIFQSSDEVEVANVHISQHTTYVEGLSTGLRTKAKPKSAFDALMEGPSAVKKTFKVHQALVKSYDGGPMNQIKILHKESKKDFDDVLAALKQNALKLRTSKAWVAYYNFMREFADVSYNYAITAHKAQGSTYKNVVILEEDLDANRNIIERNRIKYTAYSRASDSLYVLKLNEDDRPAKNT